MPYNFQLFIAAIPAAPVVVVGIFARSTERGEKASLLWTTVLTLGMVLLSILITSSPAFPIVYWTIPTVMGTLAALFLLSRPNPLTTSEKIKTLAPYVFGIGALLAIVIATGFPSLFYIIIPSLVIVLTWRVWEGRGLWRLLALIVAFILLITTSDVITAITIENLPQEYQTIFYICALSWPVVAVVLAARALCSILAGGKPRNWLAVALHLLLVVLLLLSVLYQISYSLLWDIMTDGLGAIAFAQIASFGGISAAMLLAWSLLGRRRWAALVFALVFLFGMTDATENGMRISPVTVTEQRAEDVNQAVLRYYARNARYPGALADLVPWYLWRIPEPIMIRNLTWCYEGGSDYYRLGYVFHEGFDARASVRIQGAVGVPPNPAWQCDADALKYNSEFPRH